MKYYVYKALGVDDEILYIGHGNGARHKHCYSGISHNYQLNKYHFEHNENGVTTSIIKWFENKDDAIAYEKQCIECYNPLFNTMMSPTNKIKPVSKRYITKVTQKALREHGIKQGSSTMTRITEKVLLLVDRHGYHRLLGGVSVNIQDLLKTPNSTLKTLYDSIRRSKRTNSIFKILTAERTSFDMVFLKLKFN